MGGKTESGSDIVYVGPYPLGSMLDGVKGCVSCFYGLAEGDGEGDWDVDRVGDTMATSSVAHVLPLYPVILLVECDKNGGGTPKLFFCGSGV